MVLALVLKLIFIKCPRISSKLHKVANSNSFIKFFLLTFYELVLYSVIDIVKADESLDHPAITYSHALAYVVLASSLIITIALIIVHVKVGA